jgi:cytochrome c oxidase subunit I+III
MTHIEEARRYHAPEPPEAPAGLSRAWRAPSGFRYITEINNTFIGALYVGTGMLFLVLGGVLALMIRYQLAVPGNDFLTPEQYNQVFTMHGTTMMFLFAVPIMEATSVWLMPLQLGARDLPFPRVSAYGFWCYFFGGLMSYASLFWWIAPNAGWFIYPPLSTQYAPGVNTDFWLLGIGFIEISAIAQVVEVVVGIMKTRAIGMSLDRLPIYSWYILATALMIALAFPPLILGDILMEVERALDWPFFDATRGGDPLLWQHLFWFFGHPEVYIVFLPAAGLVSTIIPTFVGVPLVGYTWVVLAALGTAFLSFGLWVHHMFTTGMPHLSLAFFSGASMAVAIPTGIQIFCWMATIWSGRPVFKTPFLFVLGFLFIFVLGGLTGVMVAAVPFDWQAHDSYFVVAHLHYVLIGGMVFPLFAAFYYWTPLYSGRMLSETLGRWTFWLMFVGFNVTFFPMHLTGLRGMPRRVYTYPAEFGWDWLNLVSSLGSAVLAAGILVFFFDFATHFRRGPKAQRNPWGAGTLEWATKLPSPDTGVRSVPPVTGHYPIWDNPTLPEKMDRGDYLLADSPHGWRETLRTGTVDARPEQIMILPRPSWLPLLAGLGTALAFISAVFYLWTWAAALGGVTLALLLTWAWNTEMRPEGETGRDIGDGTVLPYYAVGPRSHSWWAMAILVVVDASAYGGLAFAYFYIWTISDGWPPGGVEAGLDATLALLAGALLLASLLPVRLAVSADDRGRRTALIGALGAAALLGLASLWPQAALLTGSAIDPKAHTYGALVWMMVIFPMAHLALGLLMALFTLTKAAVRPKGLAWSHAVRNTALWWSWSVAQILFSLLILFLFPRLV